MRRALFGVAAVAALFVLVIPWTVVVRIDGGKPFRAAWHLAEDSPDHPRLKLLRMREPLDKVMGTGPMTVRLARLRHWTRQQWEPGVRFRYPAWDAVEILDLARHHGNRGFCAQYAIVFLQACRAMGLHARYVNLPGHFVAEVWVDELDRWVLEDPLNDIDFVRDGKPLDGRALCMAARRSGFGSIAKRGPDGKAIPSSREDVEVYSGFALETRADQLANPVEYRTGARTRRLVRKADWTRYPMMGRDNLALVHQPLAWRGAGAPADANLSGDADDFNYPFNHTIVSGPRLGLGNSLLELHLRSDNAPDFFGFDTKADSWELKGLGSREEKALPKLVRGEHWTSPGEMDVGFVLRSGWHTEAVSVMCGGFPAGGVRTRIRYVHWPGLLGR